jgi:hypothetical protein
MEKQNGKCPEPILRNHIAIVLDESGSMAAMRREIMEAFNEQVETIRESAMDQPTTVSLVKFNTSVPDPVYWTRSVDVMHPLREEDYSPHGLTAMLDAVGLTIDRLRALPDAESENTSFLVLILSDGQENNSRRFTYADIAERIEELEHTDRWTFAYMGANQDLAAVAEGLSIPRSNMLAFHASPDGVASAGTAVREGTRAWTGKRRAGQKSDKSFFQGEEREPTDKPGDFWQGTARR